MNIVSCKSEVLQENFPRGVYTAAGMLLGIESPQIVHYIEKAFFLRRRMIVRVNDISIRCCVFLSIQIRIKKYIFMHLQ